MLKFILILILFAFIAVSCKNNGNNSTETYSFESTVTPSNAGTVSPFGGSSEAGEKVQITATPKGSWVFKEWNGDVSASDNPATVEFNKNMSINALFEELTYPLTIEIEGDGDVTEQIVNAKTDYADGTTVELSANPAEEWEFIEWQDDLSGSENPSTITMDQAKTVTAVFQEKTYPLTITVKEKVRFLNRL